MFKVTGHHFDTVIIKAYMYVKVLECCIEVFYNKIGNALSYSKFILRRHFEENWDNLWVNILVQYSNNGEKIVLLNIIPSLNEWWDISVIISGYYTI